MTLFSELNHLPVLPIHSVYEDVSGYLWLASDRGLIRFDGKTFTGVDTGSIRTIASIDERHALALGNRRIFDLKGRAVTDTSTLQLLKSHNLSVHAIQEVISYDSALWILSLEGLFRVRNRELQALPLTSHNGNYKLSHLVRSDHRINVFTQRGVHEWDPSRQLFVFVPFQVGLERPRKVIPIDSSKFIILDHERLVIVNPSRRIELAEWKGLPEGFRVSCVEKYKHYVVAGSHTDGLWLGKPFGKDYVFSRVMDGNEPHRTMELPFRNILNVYAAGDNLWVTHDTGLTLLQELAFERLWNIPMASFDNAVDMPDGTIYLESDQGVFECRRTPEGEIVGKKSAVGANEIVASLTGAGNRLWVATLDYTLVYYEKNKRTRFANVRERGHSIYKMVSDRQGNVWVLQAPGPKPIIGIMKITHDLRLVEYGIDKGFDTRMLTIGETAAGKLYAAGIGENNYLYAYDEINDRFINISAPMDFDYGENFEVHDLIITPDNTIWLASTAGLLRYSNHKTSKISVDELDESEAVSLTASDDGAIWFGTDRKGIIRLKGKEYTVFDIQAGLATNTMTYRAMRTDADGTIWCGSREGIYISRPHNHSWKKTKRPRLLSVNSADIQTLRDNSFPFESTLHFDFITLAYPMENIEYVYRVLNYGTEKWMALNRHDSLIVPNLKQGNYTLQIRARQPGGYQWSDLLRYEFAIAPVWYASRAAIAGYFLVATLLVVLGTRAYNRRLIREKEILEHKVSDRTREITQKNKEITSRMEELKQLTDEIASQRDNIEHQNGQLARAKEGLEQKVHSRTLELSQANDELVDQNIQLEQFTFMTAHNLRAPIARIIGLTNIFNNHELSDPFNKEVIHRVKQSVSDLDEVVHDISTILQVKKGINGTFSLINLKMMIQKVLRSFESEMQYKNIRITTTMNEEPVVVGIEAYAFSVFYNIFSNSIKYANRKAPEINILAIERENAVIVKISDNGIGFESRAQTDKIFKPFSRFHTGGEGKGLGLYMIKIQMESMHGDVEIHSQVNVGTTVVLTFPKSN